MKIKKLIEELISELKLHKQSLIENKYAKFGKFIYENREYVKFCDNVFLNEIFVKLKQEIRYIEEKTKI